MLMDKLVLSILFFVLISFINGIPSNSYYLIDINDNNLLSNESYCSNILINDQTYRLPQQCHHHLLCNPHYCDDKTFRCIKIRETLCCLYKHLQLNCQENHSNQLKDLFRSVYFHMSIEHGYCEINLERIEKNDHAYCIANIEDTPAPVPTTTTTMSSSSIRPSFKHYHRRPLSSLRPNRYRYRIAPRQNYSSLDYLRRVTIIEENRLSKSNKISIINQFLIISSLLLSTILVY